MVSVFSAKPSRRIFRFAENAESRFNEVMGVSFTRPSCSFGLYRHFMPDGDGIVNFFDFALMAENWMQ